MERDRTPPRPEEPLHPRAETGYPRTFASYVDALGQATLEERKDLAGQINVVLERMRAPGNDAAEAAAIHAALDRHALDDLYDIDGRSCRNEAVNTLMAMGFPHALTVSPEDLEHLRRADPEARSERLRLWKVAGASVAVVGALGYGLRLARDDAAAAVDLAFFVVVLLVWGVRGLLKRK